MKNFWGILSGNQCGPLSLVERVDMSALLCHKEPARRIQLGLEAGLWETVLNPVLKTRTECVWFFIKPFLTIREKLFWWLPGQYVCHNSSNFKLCLIWPNWYCLIHFYKRCVSTLAWLWRCALLRNELFMLTTRLLLLKSCPNISERSFFQNNITYSSNILTEKCSWTRSAGECRWWSCFLW